MTYPDEPFPRLTPAEEALFGTAAADYARYRPGLPDATVRLLAAAPTRMPATVF
ncbi:hypothetical protein ACFV7R_41675 [Streptomyces sp. NPDC059866]|uniref:hypothetical protein n=1 Tax=Streptomyces sp. NPDC059866 TaxID=3346978 RepID=UPI0036618A54